MANTAPALLSLTLSPTVNVSADPHLYFTVNAQDDSAVTDVMIELDRPLYLSQSDRVGMYFNMLSFSVAGSQSSWSGTGTRGELKISPYALAGAYHVSAVTVTDSGGLSHRYDAAELKQLGIATAFNVAGTTPDQSAPVLDQLGIPVKLDTSQGAVRFDLGARAHDDASGVSVLTATFNKGIGQTFIVDGSPDWPAYRIDPVLQIWDKPYQWASGSNATSYLLAGQDGIYNLDSVLVVDRMGNQRSYGTYELGKMGVNTSMEINNGTSVPTRLAISASEAGGDIVVRVAASALAAGVNAFQLTVNYDNALARLSGWSIGAAGVEPVSGPAGGIALDAAKGSATLSGVLLNGTSTSGYLDLHFTAQASKGSFSYDIWNVSVNNKTVANAFNNTLAYSVSQLTRGTAAADQLRGSGADDLLQGLGGDDVFTDVAGIDRVDGGAGRDRVSYAAKLADYRITLAGADIKVSHAGPDAPAQTLTNVERLAFADLTLAFDSNAAQALRLYQAAFNRAPDAQGLGFWINALDHGVSLREVARNFVASSEFKLLLGEHPSNAAVVDSFYANVLHRAGDAEGVKFWTDALDHGVAPSQVLADFSESAENQLQTAALIAQGVGFLPFA